MECQKCGGVMRRGEVQGEEPREAIVLCIGCGYTSTLGGAPWPLDFDRHTWEHGGDTPRYRLGVLECPKCAGPMRRSEFPAEPDPEVLFICKWCGFSREKGAPEGEVPVPQEGQPGAR